MKRDASFEELRGMTLTSIVGEVGDDEIIFTTDSGRRFKLYHDRVCCENVTVEDICGDWEDIIGTPILLAEEVSHHNEDPDGVDIPERQDSFTWTFYKLATNQGAVTIRWYGESNGNYSESADFSEIE